MGAPQQFPSAGFPARASLGPLTPDQERQSAKWTHLGPALIWWIGGVLTCGLATLLAFVPPLVILNGSGQRSAWVRANAVNALNFQLSLLIYNIGLMVFSVVFGVMTFWLDHRVANRAGVLDRIRDPDVHGSLCGGQRAVVPIPAHHPDGALSRHARSALTGSSS
jgi:uncharacterized Tic20 family protein